jgi:4-diphosphocytidyl-2-C-methyl-D-erythritol kinase
MAHIEQAPAKLTISLRCTGVRADGYHLIDAEMVSLDLVDTLAFTEAPDIALHLTSDANAGRGLPVTLGDDNLVAKALRRLNRTAHVTIHKRIPAGGGLGGGSANAAAVYRWAGRTSDADVIESAKLGADVAFCIRGGRARVLGIGEILEPLPFVARTFTLLTPPFGVSTPAVYQAWDALGGPTAAGVNDLEPAAMVVEPRLQEWRDRLGEITGVTPTLAGSGSTWFVEGAFEGPDLVVTQTTPHENGVG